MWEATARASLEAIYAAPDCYAARASDWHKLEAELRAAKARVSQFCAGWEELGAIAGPDAAISGQRTIEERSLPSSPLSTRKLVHGARGSDCGATLCRRPDSNTAVTKHRPPTRSRFGCFLSRVAQAGAALVLSSCATTPQPAAPGGFARGSSGSDLVIKSTGFRFPPRIGVFVRAGSQQYDAAGQDLSVKYQAGAVIVADVYDYPAGGKTLSTEFANRKEEIKSYHADARLLREGAVTIHSGGKARQGHKAVFAVSQGYHYNFPPPYQSDLLVFQRGNHFLEYRFSYSAAHREAAESEIAKFVGALAWPAD